MCNIPSSHLNGIVSRNNGIVSRNNRIVSQNNRVVSRNNAIATPKDLCVSCRDCKEEIKGTSAVFSLGSGLSLWEPHAYCNLLYEAKVSSFALVVPRYCLG
ncbi:hypothetical protein [Nostoc sp.]|uniref:hypothetical protein n=1 Tax=Nostoc sp. TaxID=1180 RepID=UPI002FFCC152